jgi:hypothetical protein
LAYTLEEEEEEEEEEDDDDDDDDDGSRSSLVLSTLSWLHLITSAEKSNSGRSIRSLSVF